MVPHSILDVSEDEMIDAPPRMSEDEYVAWALAIEGNAEWVDGEVIVFPSQPFRVIEVRMWLSQVLGIYVQTKKLGEVLGMQLMVRLKQHSVNSRRVPDLLFVSRANRHQLKTYHHEGPPELMIEVVSPESRKRDLNDKFVEYEAAGVLEYWIVDPEMCSLQASVRNAAGKFVPVELDASGKLHSATVAGFWLKPEWLWQEELPNPLDILRELAVLGSEQVA